MFLSGPIPQEPDSKAEPGTQEAEEVCPCKGMSKVGLHKREKSNCHTAAAKTSVHLLGGRELGWSFRVFPNQDKNIRSFRLSISQSQAVGYTWGRDVNLGKWSLSMGDISPRKTWSEESATNNPGGWERSACVLMRDVDTAHLHTICTICEVPGTQWNLNSRELFWQLFGSLTNLEARDAMPVNRLTLSNLSNVSLFGRD